MTQFLTLKKLAVHLGVTRQTASRWFKKGYFPGIPMSKNLYLFDPAAVEGALRRRQLIHSKPESDHGGRGADG